MKTTAQQHQAGTNGQAQINPATLTRDQERHLFATMADAALKAGGWQVLDAVNYWKNKIDSFT